MRAQRCARRTSQRSIATASAPQAVPAGTFLGQHAEALRTRPGDLDVEDLREIGRQIEVCLRSGGREAATAAEDDDCDDGGCRVRAAGLEAAALFTATCSIRSEKDQEVLLSIQDKVLMGLRALSWSLAPELHRPFQTALLSLVAQSGFTKKRKGCRQHLVQALAEAAAGAVPPCALLPTLRAKETGPSATDLVMEVLKTVAGNEHDSSNGPGGTKSKKGILELLHHVVAEVVTSGMAKRGKRATKGPSAHLIALLVQSCVALPEYMLVFSKDLLLLMESRSSSTRKLSLAVLRAILAYGNGHQRKTHGSAIAAVLRLTRLDGDASVRSSAFDTVAEYLDQEAGHFNELCGTSASDSDNNATSEYGRQQAKTTKESPSDEHSRTIAGGIEMEVTPCPDTATNTGYDLKRTPKRTSPAPVCEAGDVESSKHTGEKGAVDPWAIDGVILSSLSASADALLTDGSKAVRAKALTCSLCILTTHGGGIDPGCFCHGAPEARRAPVGSNALKKTLQAVAKGAWRALEAVATDISGTMQACAGSAGGGRSRRAADAARDLLSLPCMGASPVDMIVCYARCNGGTGAGKGAAVATAEATRAVRDIARVRLCADIDSFLKAVSAVMAADFDGEEGGDTAEPFRDETAGGILPEGFTSKSLSEVLCEVLAGIDIEVIMSLLRDALELYTQEEETGRRDGSGAKAPVLLRALLLLGEASGFSVSKGTRQVEIRQGDGNRAYDTARILAKSRHLFWRRLEQLMEEVLHHESGEAGGRRCDSPHESESSMSGRSFDVGHSVGGGGGAETSGACGRFDAHGSKQKSTADSELSELLGIFRLLASRSLLPPDNGAALEALVFPSALSRRRFIRPAVGLALALEQPRRVLLSSLAILQDASFARLSTDVARACDYVRLIGVLARENASFIAAHVREQYDIVEGRSGNDLPREGKKEGDEDGDYMAGVSNRQAMETEIRRFREASVTSDGMLSCYTPFLLAIVQRCVADSAAKTPPTVEQEDVPLPASGDSDNGNDDVVGTENENAHKIFEKDEEQQSHRAQGDSLCPWALCVEALWALSEYAVLSPGLASAEVLPLAAALAGDTTECPQIRAAAVCALTRRELATDEIAAHACGLLGDENPCLRQKVLRRLGSLMKENRIKTAHLSKFALLLVDKDERVRETAQGLFVDHLQPRPDSVCRCLFEIYFTLDATETVKRAVLDSLIVVSQRAAPSQGLGSLAGALMRKTAETGDADAAFFLSSVPPTIESFEVAEVALRRGQLAQAPLETISLAVAHFAKRAHRRGSAATGLGPANGRGAEWGRNGGTDLLPTAQALVMADRIGSLSARRRVGRLSRAAVEAVKEISKPTQPDGTDDDTQQGEKGGAVCTPPATSRRTRRVSPTPRKEQGGRPVKKRRRPRETSNGHRGGSGNRCAKANGNDDKSEGGRNGVEVSADGEAEDDEEEMEWEG